MKSNILFLLFSIIICQGLSSQAEPTDAEKAFSNAQKFRYINKDSAYYYYEKTIALANAKNDLDYLFMGLSYLLNANGYFYDLPSYQNNIQRLDSLLQNDNRVDSFEWADYYKNYILFDKGNYYYKTKEYSKSKKYLLELSTKLNNLPQSELYGDDIDMLSSINSFLGLINLHTGKYEQAEYTFTKDIEMVTSFSDSLEHWESSILGTKRLLSQVYEAQNRKEEANQMLHEVLDYYSLRTNIPAFRNSYLSTLMLFAKNLCNQGNYQEALDLLAQVDDSNENPFLKEIESIKADAYLGQGKIALAQEYYESALSSYIAYRQQQPHQDIAMAYGKMVEFYLHQKKIKKAGQYLLLAFKASGPTINSRSLSDNPKPETVFSKRQLLYLLDLKLQVLATGNLDADHSDRINTCQEVLATFDLLKKEFESKVDKQFLAETAYPIFHRMLGIVYRLYEDTPSGELLPLALTIAEKNKDFILLEALRSTNASEYGDVPKEVIEYGAQLRAQIAQLEKSLFDATDKTNEFSQELGILKENYYAHLADLKAKYPKYHNLKYNNVDLSIEEVRADILQKEDLLISFTVTEEYLYAIVVGQTTERFVQIDFVEEDRKEVTDFYKLISRPSLSITENDIKRSGGRLFEKILQKPIQGIKGQNLIIIPDDVLHYLPFDLLSENNRYLLEGKTVGYANSLSSLRELRNKESAEIENSLAFAPSFENQSAESNQRRFGRLRYNTDEVGAIGDYFETTTFLNTTATLSNFVTEAPKASNIHLATHASANDQFPDFSYLAFTRQADSSAQDILYSKELYAMSLNADMVTLSACQTGIGKLRKGQGMLSLSKGFYYAGAKSLVNTLWKINDKSTVKLMESFYRELSEGKSKTEALRLAKLDYLKNTDDDLLRHPYYWAAFTVSGDSSPLHNTANNNLWWLLLLVPILILGFSRLKQNAQSN